MIWPREFFENYMMLLEIIENTPGVAKAEQRNLNKALERREGKGGAEPGAEQNP